jgi:hypothetical protein
MALELVLGQDFGPLLAAAVKTVVATVVTYAVRPDHGPTASAVVGLGCIEPQVGATDALAVLGGAALRRGHGEGGGGEEHPWVRI